VRCCCEARGPSKQDSIACCITRGEQIRQIRASSAGSPLLALDTPADGARPKTPREDP
jgi:hypothetical protein